MLLDKYTYINNLILNLNKVIYKFIDNLNIL